MPDDDYRRLATLSFEGGVMNKAKMASIARKAVKNMKQEQ